MNPARTNLRGHSGERTRLSLESKHRTWQLIQTAALYKSSSSNPSRVHLRPIPIGQSQRTAKGDQAVRVDLAVEALVHRTVVLLAVAGQAEVAVVEEVQAEDSLLGTFSPRSCL